MATAAKRALCSTCGKENGQVTCEGCSKTFCINDFNGHRQELSKELDEVEVARDLFRQTLIDKTEEPQNCIFIEQINEWENESISKIRQVAEGARQILLKHTAELNTKIENKLNKLTNQLRQSREKNEFSELDLGEWRKELTQMKDELMKPSSVTIRQDQTSLVTKIIVAISDVGQDKKSSGTIHMAMTINNAEQLVSCSFCDEKFSSSTIGEHLMICGNKTNQCRNCRQYIRRAIFRYHYENNCANLVEFDADGSAATNEPDTFSTFQSNNLPLFPARLAAGSKKLVSPWDLDLSTHSTRYTSALQRSDSDFRESKLITNASPFGYQQSAIDKRDTHQKKFIQNPNNIPKREQPWLNTTYSQKLGRLNHVDDSKDTIEIPCELCNQLIEWHDYDNHVQTCATQNDQRIQEQPQLINKKDEPDYGRCKYCNKNLRISFLENHQKNCTQSPV